MNTEDIKAQALWEIQLEDFELLVRKEKARLREKREWFPWRLKLINLNEVRNERK